MAKRATVRVIGHALAQGTHGQPFVDGRALSLVSIIFAQVTRAKVRSFSSLGKRCVSSKKIAKAPSTRQFSSVSREFLVLVRPHVPFLLERDTFLMILTHSKIFSLRFQNQCLNTDRVVPLNTYTSWVNPKWP